MVSGMATQAAGMAGRCCLLSSDSAFFALFWKNYEIDTLSLFHWQPHVSSPYQLLAFSVNADHACNFCGTAQHANTRVRYHSCHESTGARLTYNS